MSDHSALPISEALAARAKKIEEDLEKKIKDVPGLSPEYLAGNIEQLGSLVTALMSAVVGLEKELIQTNSQLAQVTAKVL